MKKETIIKEANDLFDQFIPMQNEIRKKSEEYIKSVLQEHPDGIIFDDYPVSNGITVNYDGGNHPEYASNCFSTVYGVYLDKDGDVILDTEDCDVYPLENLDWDEVYTVADYIDKEIFKKG